ncbi:MAG: response regulator [Desulfuromonadales bacterium]|nr:response regulator [Desulfuromonadales bacterium]
MNNETILIVDDEPNILNAIKRLLADSGYEVLTAGNAEQGRALLQNREVALVLSDNCMPGRSGVDFLAQVKLMSPNTERMLMTAFANLDTAIDAINRGEIFRFIVKPWDNNGLLGAIEDSLMHYRLVNTLKVGGEAMFLSMARMIELKDPYTRGHCSRVADYALAIAEQLNLHNALLKEIQWGSWLHDCGKVGIPEHILNYPGKLSEDDFNFVRKHPEWGASVVSQAGLSQHVVNIVLYHHEHFAGGGYPFGLKGQQIPLEARIVAVADVYDALITDRPYRPAHPEPKVRSIMEEMKHSILDPSLVDLLFLTRDALDFTDSVTACRMLATSTAN